MRPRVKVTHQHVVRRTASPDGALGGSFDAERKADENTALCVAQIVSSVYENSMSTGNLDMPEVLFVSLRGALPHLVQPGRDAAHALFILSPRKLKCFNTESLEPTSGSLDALSGCISNQKELFHMFITYKQKAC